MGYRVTKQRASRMRVLITSNILSPVLRLMAVPRGVDFISFFSVIFIPSPSEQAGFGEPLAEIIGDQQEHDVHQRIEQAHRRGHGIHGVSPAEGQAVGVGGNHVRYLIGGGIVQQQDFFIAHVQNVAHAQDEQDHDGGQESRQGDVQQLLKAVGPVDAGRLVLFLVDTGEGRQINDGVPSDAVPDIRQNIDGAEVGRVHQVILGRAPEEHADLAEQAVLLAVNLDQRAGDHHGNEVGHVSDGLHGALEFIAAHLVQQQR